MAWKYPKRPIKGTYVADIDAINENFLTVIEESTGYLNEHNFQASGLDADGNLLAVTEPEQLIALRQAVVPVSGRSNQLPEDIGHILHYSRQVGPSPDTNGSDWTEVSGTDFYQTFDGDGFKITANFKGSLVWICASFTIHTHDIPRRALSTWATGGQFPTTKAYGLNMGLMLDGALIPESLVGSGDITQENFRDDNNEYKGGGGINGGRNAIVLDAVVYIPPGNHTIEIGVQDLRGALAEGAYNKLNISTSELFALELVR